jgi:hypothetical protein
MGCLPVLGLSIHVGTRNETRPHWERNFEWVLRHCRAPRWLFGNGRQGWAPAEGSDQ